MHPDQHPTVKAAHIIFKYTTRVHASHTLCYCKSFIQSLVPPKVPNNTATAPVKFAFSPEPGGCICLGDVALCTANLKSIITYASMGQKVVFWVKQNGACGVR